MMKMTKALIFAVMLMSVQGALAEDTTERLSQSVEGLVAGSDKSLAATLEQAEIDIHKPMVVMGSRQVSMGSRLAAAHYSGQVFTIFDAKTVISRDDDDDGYYHRLRVTFDPDVSTGRAWVYAKLYLSLEGGPWNHYYTTENFPVDEDSSDDDYEVVTNLLDGYPSGYYDVLIELYDADSDHWVTEYDSYDDQDLAVLPLEDSYRDDDYHEGGGGAVDIGLLLLGLGLLFVRRKNH